MKAEHIIRNQITEAIVERADGLPLYVRHVLEDLRSGHFRVAELPHKLPHGLSEYYDDLLQRLSIGDLHAILTPLIVTLAWARAPLGEDTLQLLLERRKVLTNKSSARDLLARALAAVQSMIRKQGGRYRLYHPRFQEHIRRDEAGSMGEQNELARRELAELATAWRELDRGTDAYLYTLRFGPEHLAEAGRLKDLAKLFLDLEFAALRSREFGPYGYTALFAEVVDRTEEFRAVERALEQTDHLQADDPDLFLQHLQNMLQQRLGDPRRVEQLVSRVPCPSRWLSLTNSPPLGSAAALIRTLKVESGVLSVAFAPSAGLLASGSTDGKVKVWSADTGRLLQTLAGHSGAVRALAFGEGLLASGSSDGTVRLWDPVNGRPKHTLTLHPGAVTSLAIGQGFVVSAYLDGPIILCKTSTLEQVHTLATPSFCLSMAIDSLQGLLVYALEGGAIRKLDLKSNLFPAVMGEIKLHFPQVSFHVSGSLAAVVPGGGALELWDVQQDRMLWKGDRSWIMGPAAVDAVRCLVAVASEEALHLYDLPTGQFLGGIDGHAGCIQSLDIDESRGLLATGSEDGMIRIWDTALIRMWLTRHVSLPQSTDGWHEPIRGLMDQLSGTPARFPQVAIDVAHGTMATVFGGLRFHKDEPADEIALWELETAQLWRTLRGSFGVPVLLDGGNLMVAKESIDLLDAETGLRMSRFMGLSEFYECVRIDVAHGLAVGGSVDGAVTVWDLKSGDVLHTLKGHNSPVWSVAIDGVCRLVASGSADGVVTVWDLETGHRLRTLEGHSGAVWSISVDRVSGLVASGAFDRTVRVWDLNAGVCVCQRQFGARVLAVCFDPDRRGRLLVVERGEDGFPCAWDFNLEEPRGRSWKCG